jgi:hypothetical protein
MKNMGFTKADAVCHHLHFMQACVLIRGSLCEICDRHSGTGTGFPPSSLVLPSQYPSITPYSIIYHVGLNSGPISSCRSIETVLPPSQQ